MRSVVLYMAYALLVGCMALADAEMMLASALGSLACRLVLFLAFEAMVRRLRCEGDDSFGARLPVMKSFRVSLL